MTRVVVSDAGSRDQADVLRDLMAKAGAPTATKYANLVDRLFYLLADHPGIGAARPGLGPGIRIGIVLPYPVIHDYGDRDDTVTTFRIVHGRRNITRAFLRTQG